MEFKEGDYFRWKYKPHIVAKLQEDVRAGTLYWCCSKIAIFKSGRLQDTYWSSGSNGRAWTIEDAQKELDLTFLENADNMEPTNSPQYYAPEDVVDIRHPNLMRGGLYIRKGAKRSKSQMISLINHKISEAQGKIDWEAWNIKTLKQKLVDIENADLEKFTI